MKLTCEDCRHWEATEVSAGGGYHWGKCNARPTLFHEPHSGSEPCDKFEEEKGESDGKMLLR